MRLENKSLSSIVPHDEVVVNNALYSRVTTGKFGYFYEQSSHPSF